MSLEQKEKLQVLMKGLYFSQVTSAFFVGKGTEFSLFALKFPDQGMQIVGLGCLVHHLGRIHATLHGYWATMKYIALKKYREMHRERSVPRDLPCKKTGMSVRCLMGFSKEIYSKESIFLDSASSCTEI